MKVVINDRFGGFSLSDEALKALAERKGVTLHWFAFVLNHGRGKLLPLDDVLASPTLSNLHYLTSAYTSDDPEKGEYFDNRPSERADPDLIAVVEELGEKANGQHASLKIVEIPDGVEWIIEEYDGNEWVAEQHRVWRA